MRARTSCSDMSARSALDHDGARRADLAAIHIGKKALGWDDEFYRTIMTAKCGVASSALLDHAGRKRLLAHMKACGWQGGNGRHTGPAKTGSEPSHAARKPLTAPQKKMWALWQSLADAGKTTNRKMPGLVAFAHRQTGVDLLDWLTAAQEDLVIESLKSWLKRRPGAA